MANGRNNFNWPQDRWDRINKVVHDEAAKVRVARRVLPLFGNSGGFVDTIAGYQVTAGPVLSIRSGQQLVPVEISSEFELSPEQFNDEQVAMALGIKASNRVAIAEDAVILLGAAANAVLQQLNVESRNLDQQVGLIVPARAAASAGATGSKPSAGSGASTPGAAGVGQPILESILDARRRLQKANQHGDYCVIVSPDLYQEAYKPRTNTLDAAIYEIRPILREGGFLYSDALPEKTGVMFSLGGDTLDLAVPVDATTEFVIEDKVAKLRVVEQLRLRVNDPTAAVALA